MGKLAKRYAEFQKRGVTIITVAADRRSKTDALSHAKHAPFSMLSDPRLEVISTWGVREAGKQKIAAPCMFLLARGGKVLWRYLGKRMSDRPALDEVLRVIDRLVTAPAARP